MATFGPQQQTAVTTLGPVLDDRLLELVAGKQLQHLAENAGYSYHGGGGPPCDSRLSTQTASSIYRRRSIPNLDKSEAAIAVTLLEKPVAIQELPRNPVQQVSVYLRSDYFHRDVDCDLYLRVPSSWWPSISLQRGGFFYGLVAIVRDASSSSSEVASMVRKPGFFEACRIACAKPLNKLLSFPLSDSWQFGSPLPRPISAPSPDTLKRIVLSAVGTKRPLLSTVSTRTIARSSPSAAGSARSAVRRIFAGDPVVSCFATSTTLEPFVPRAST